VALHDHMRNTVQLSLTSEWQHSHATRHCCSFMIPVQRPIDDPAVSAVHDANAGKRIQQTEAVIQLISLGKVRRRFSVLACTSITNRLLYH
jgi:hypothetical protein